MAGRRRVQAVDRVVHVVVDLCDPVLAAEDPLVNDRPRRERGMQDADLDDVLVPAGDVHVEQAGVGSPLHIPLARLFPELNRADDVAGRILEREREMRFIVETIDAAGVGLDVLPVPGGIGQRREGRDGRVLERGQVRALAPAVVHALYAAHRDRDRVGPVVDDLQVGAFPHSVFSPQAGGAAVVGVEGIHWATDGSVRPDPARIS